MASSIDTLNFEVIRTEVKDTENLPKNFQQASRTLGAGGDGQVMSYRHLLTTHRVARKFPNNGDHRGSWAIIDESNNLTRIGPHPNIIGFYGLHGRNPSGFAESGLFLEYCSAGDALHYFGDIRRTRLQQIQAGQPGEPGPFPPERIIWKFFKDVSAGLAHMHSQRCVHGDLKPGNILVHISSKGNDQMPTFKIADFGRMCQYPCGLPSDKGHGYIGTDEYAPPLEEQAHPITQATDIWSLGASIQELALNRLATESHNGWKKRQERLRNARQRYAPVKQRNNTIVVYRPIDKAWRDMQEYDVGEHNRDYQPYSTPLNNWYSACMDQNPATRITSEDLVKHMHPMIDAHIRAQASMTRAQAHLADAQKIRNKIEAGRKKREQEAAHRRRQETEEDDKREIH